MYKEFKQTIYKKLIPLIRLIKKIHWLFYRHASKSINLIIGAGTIKFKGWFATDIATLDVTNESHFKKYFNKKKIDKVLAEHVLEHLTDKELDLMIKHLFKYSSEDVNIRIAVPDGFHKDEKYIDLVKPGGTGEGADDHKHLFNYKSLSEKFKKWNFVPYLKEYWDENGEFHSIYINDEFGTIRRSFLNDLRNKDKKPHYTSLIIDFKKE